MVVSKKATTSALVDGSSLRTNNSKDGDAKTRWKSDGEESSTRNGPMKLTFANLTAITTLTSIRSSLSKNDGCITRIKCIKILFYDDYSSSIINNKGDSISLFKNLPTYFWSLDLNRIYKIDYKISMFIYKDGIKYSQK